MKVLIKNLILTILASIGFYGTATAVNLPKTALEEFSANFDLVNVEPFLDRVSKLTDTGFGKEEIRQVTKTLSKMKPDEESDLEFSVTFEGHQEKIKLHLFLDDIDAPDLYFFTSHALSKKIEKQYITFTEEKGI